VIRQSDAVLLSSLFFIFPLSPRLFLTKEKEERWNDTIPGCTQNKEERFHAR
jgi:hypothetical protein